MTQIGKKITHLDNVIPITYDDHQHYGLGFYLYLSDIIDRDMVYRNTLEQEDWLFDSNGQWSEEGVSHPELSLAKNFREREYYENVHNF